MIIIGSIIVLLGASVWGFTSQQKFGNYPDPSNNPKIISSKNFKDGEFHNVTSTPVMSDDKSIFTTFFEFFFSSDTRPKEAIPSIKTNLFELNKNENLMVWFGHSSYMMQLDEKKILVDPVLNGYASPVFFMIKAFDGTDIYKAEDIPEIDYLVLTHDHWDHLDYPTIMKLQPKIKKIICPLGVGNHLVYWGFDKNIISEMDWDESTTFDDSFVFNAHTARHFSGRAFKRNQTLWASFVVQTPSKTVYIGGDSGYDKHFKEIGTKYGVIDLAFLENGQYNEAWKYIHTHPKQTLKAAQDLNAKKFLPVHSGKFSLANHTWDEPLRLISKYNETENLNLITPKIGEIVRIDDDGQKFSKWWESIR